MADRGEGGWQMRRGRMADRGEGGWQVEEREDGR